MLRAARSNAFAAESRISRIYNRWRHFPQMKSALEKYEEKLSALISSH
jgi:hypothetical protein